MCHVVHVVRVSERCTDVDRVCLHVGRWWIGPHRATSSCRVPTSSRSGSLTPPTSGCCRMWGGMRRAAPPRPTSPPLPPPLPMERWITSPTITWSCSACRCFPTSLLYIHPPLLPCPAYNHLYFSIPHASTSALLFFVHTPLSAGQALMLWNHTRHLFARY